MLHFADAAALSKIIEEVIIDNDLAPPAFLLNHCELLLLSRKDVKIVHICGFAFLVLGLDGIGKVTGRFAGRKVFQRLDNYDLGAMGMRIDVQLRLRLPGGVFFACE